MAIPGTRSIFLMLVIVALRFAPDTIAGGPDLIVGDIFETMNYTSSGDLGGFRAYSLGMKPCNLGVGTIDWIAGTSDHPVATQNMYRLAAGRFEQLGQAWIPHGFCALHESLCSTCSKPAGNCDGLEAGCSSRDSASFNGSQGGLAPKSEVNAHTGAFPFPWFNNGTGSGALFKRLQVAEADLSTAGALYFVSSMYVSPNDAAAGNNDNNESYRRVSVGAAPARNLTLLDATERESPAIFAWRDHGLGAGMIDSEVKLIPLDVSNEGRFWLGYKPTSLGGGQWQYEFALQNLNSHRSGQAFSVSIPTGAAITNIGFRDVPYHSGEPYSGADWLSSVSASNVTWATQTFAQNQNANALRWDTIYNFRFEANFPPSQISQVVLSLFRTGSPASVTGFLPPIHDLCANAAPATDGTFLFSCQAATSGPPFEPACLTGPGSGTIGNDLWYRYTAACDGQITVSLCGSGFDTRMAAYTGTCPVANNTAIVCNNDFCGQQSQLTFAATGGASYLIRIGGTIQGSGTMTISSTSCWLLGDMNCDGVVTVGDIGGFVLALTNPPQYAIVYPMCNIDNADVNGDDVTSVSDIGPFVALLTGG